MIISFLLILLLPLLTSATDRTLDPWFTSNPWAEWSPRRIRSLAYDSQWYIIVGGEFFRYNGVNNTWIIKIDAQRSVVWSFLVGWWFDGIVEVVRTDSSDHIYVGWDFWSYHGETISRPIRLLPDGTRDTSFSVAVNNRVHSILIDEPNNHIYIGGRFSQVQWQTRNRIARLFLDGTLDTSFDPWVWPNSTVRWIGLGPNNTIYIVGRFWTIGGTTRWWVARLLTDGSLDMTFDPWVWVAWWVPNVHDIASLPDGSLVIGWDFVTYQGIVTNGAAWINHDGSLRYALAWSEPVRSYNAVIAQPDESVVIWWEWWVFLRFDRNGIRDTPTVQTASSIIHSLMYYPATHTLYAWWVFATHNGQPRRWTTSILQSPRRDIRPDDFVFGPTTGDTPWILVSNSIIISGITTGITLRISSWCELSINNDPFDAWPRLAVTNGSQVQLRTTINSYATSTVCTLTWWLTVWSRTGSIGSFLTIIWSGGNTQTLLSWPILLTWLVQSVGWWDMISDAQWQFAINSWWFGTSSTVQTGDIITLSVYLVWPTTILLTWSTWWQIQPIQLNLSIITHPPSLPPSVPSPAPRGGWSAWQLEVDQCPQGDASPSYYDKRCDRDNMTDQVTVRHLAHSSLLMNQHNDFFSWFTEQSNSTLLTINR